MSKLLPCPFCGRSDLVGPEQTHDGWHIIKCRTCGAEGPSRHTAVEAEARWNSRGAAEAPAETPRETFTEEGWALQFIHEPAVFVGGGSAQAATLRARASDWTRYEPTDWRPAYIHRTVTVQVHEPAPRSEP